VAITSLCGGQGACGKCRVHLTEGQVSALSAAEREHLDEEQIAEGTRLACQVHLGGPARVSVPRASLAMEQRLQVTASAGAFSMDEPVLELCTLRAEPPVLAHPTSDWTRVIAQLPPSPDGSGWRAGLDAVRELPGLLREHDGEVQARLRGSEVTSFAPPGARTLGLAVDLGTTKIAAYLLDMVSGEVLGTEGVPNPQIPYGEDIVSRLTYAVRDPEGGGVLAGVIAGTLNEVAGRLAGAAGASPKDIHEVCLVGNTAITHLTLRLPVRQLITAPFVAATAEAVETTAAELGLDFAPEARVFVPPCIAGFVGADHVAMILAAGLDEAQGISLGIDIGTNTEIVLSQPGRPTVSVSCASGPAFEGAHIRHGMRAARGAIERVGIVNGKARTGTIDDAPAVGICGSGIVDVVAELAQSGLLNGHGRLRADAEGVRDTEHGREYVLVPAQESGTGEAITVSQPDVDEILLAKGAIASGIHVLLESQGLAPDALQRVVLAGAFGTYLHVDSAIRLGMLPDLPLERFEQVGNAAGEGAKWMLVSRRARRKAIELGRRGRYIELTAYPGFQKTFARACMLPDGVRVS
jgi:uncharacterized 2Fe-2S/4Fe-4S cluster protein (DUF4445 family)